MEAHNSSHSPNLSTPASPQAINPTKMYSPNQIGAASALGGPVAVIYFLMVNFAVLKNEALKKETLVIGLIAIVAMWVFLPLLPDGFPSTPLTVCYVLVGRMVAERHQMTKQAIIDSPNHAFHSNWRVFGLSLVCLLGSVVVLLAPFFVLDVLGF